MFLGGSRLAVSHLTRPRPMAVSRLLVFCEIVSTRHDYNTRHGVAAVLDCALSRLSVLRALAYEIKKASLFYVSESATLARA